jgi:hypothetical protein
MLHAIVLAILVLLALQFLTGIVVNIYVQPPAIHPGANASNYFLGVAQVIAWALAGAIPSLTAHVALGLLLALVSLIMIGFSIAARQQQALAASLIGCLGIFLATLNGASFLNYGADVNSLLMSVGFAIAAVSYAVCFSITAGR